MLSPKLLFPADRHDLIMAKLLPPGLKHTLQRQSTPQWKHMVPPCIFALPKWRSQERKNKIVWRSVISFSNHPLKPLGRLISRCLSIVVNEVHKILPFLSMPSMLGVRDMFFSLNDMHRDHPIALRERDMDNCYWEVGKANVIEAISEARDTVVEGRGITGALWFSVAKGGDRARDRIGKASSKIFHTIPFELVQRYVTLPITCFSVQRTSCWPRETRECQ